MSKKKDAKKAAKKARKIAEAGTFTPFVSEEALVTTLDTEVQTRQDAEVARQWLHRKSVDYKLEGPADIVAEPLDETEVSAGASGKDVAPNSPAPRAFHGLGPIEGYHDFVASYSGMVCAQLVIRDEETDECGMLASNNVHQRVRQLIPSPVIPVLESPADPVLVNGNGQAMIHYTDPATGLEKVKGYTRVTTYIDGLDDKSVLTKWKMRTLLEGGAVELLQNYGDSPALGSVARSVKRLDEALADIDGREKLDGELLQLRRQELLKEHRTALEAIAEELMELGGAHEKANKGTDLHRLTELVDNHLANGRAWKVAGQSVDPIEYALSALPDDTTASDRRDVRAYAEKMAELGITTLWTERRVVLDDIQVSGTMDRAYQVRLPGMVRRSRVVGDLKTGSVSWGQGKIACQLALYSRGLGYDWTKPLERERLSLSKTHALLVHLPQGEGRCEVYVVDLELAAKGLELARQIREWRRDQKRAYDLKSPMTPALEVKA